MHAPRLQYLVLVARHVALVVDLDHHVAPALLQHPAAGLLHRAAHRSLVAQPLVLAEVEDAQHHHHAELVGAPQDPAQSREMAAGLRRQGAAGGERRIVPRLRVGARQSAPHLGVGVCDLPLGEQLPELIGAVVAERRPTLQVDGDRGQPVRAVERQAAHEFVGVAVGVPAARIRVAPQEAGGRVGIIEDRVRHAAVQQQSFDTPATVLPLPIGGLAVDEPRFALDFRVGLSLHRLVPESPSAPLRRRWHNMLGPYGTSCSRITRHRGPPRCPCSGTSPDLRSRNPGCGPWSGPPDCP